MANEIIALRSQLLNSLAKQLAFSNYVLHRSENEFTRVQPPGKHIVAPLFYNKHRSSFDIAAYVWIRFDSIEGLIARYMTYADARLEQRMITLGGWLNSKNIGEYQHWHVTGIDDVDDVVPKMKEAVVGVAEPFIREVSSLEKVVEICSRDDGSVYKYCPGHLKRAENAIAAAFLLRNFSMFEQIASSKIDFLRTQRQISSDIPLFVNMVEGLRQQWHTGS